MGRISTWFPVMMMAISTSASREGMKKGGAQSTMAVVPIAAMFEEPMNGAWVL